MKNCGATMNNMSLDTFGDVQAQLIARRAHEVALTQPANSPPGWFFPGMVPPVGIYLNVPAAVLNRRDAIIQGNQPTLGATPAPAAQANAVQSYLASVYASLYGQTTSGGQG